MSFISNIIKPVIAMGAMGLVFGLGLAYALKILRIEPDPAIFKILSLLPGSNCGACGHAGCAGFAEALKRGDAMPSGCVVSTVEARKSVAEVLGLGLDSRVKTVAALICSGGVRAKNKFVYRGIESCRAASLIFGGHKACSFGCLGLEDCVRACPFDAIAMGADEIPVVDESKCTACGKCVKACPKALYMLAPVSSLYYVKCSSKDKGSVTASVCRSGCIACFKCEKACPVGAARVEAHLSRIDPDICRNIGKCFEVCPTKVIAKR